MTSATYQVHAIESSNIRPRIRRKSNERAIQDSVVIIGLLMFLVSFGLLIETNLRHNGWNESRNKKIAVCVSFLVFGAFSALFGFYIWKRWPKDCSQTPQRNPSVS